MSKTSVDIFDLATQKPVTAELRDGLKALDLVEAEALWVPARYRCIAALLRSGKSVDDFPDNHHWNWWEKAGALKFIDIEMFGIWYTDRWQGLTMLSSSTLNRARIESQKGKELVYVKYLESAPWNVAAFTKPLNESPQFGAIGTRLLEVAVRRSVDHGFRGRVGLHALPNPETEGFYKKKGMEFLGRDKPVENLPYYEFSESAAQEFLKGGE